MMDNGNRRNSLQRSASLKPVPVNRHLQQMQQGNFSDALSVSTAMLQLIESGASTSYLFPPELILNLLRLVAAYTESPIGAVLATSERTEFLRAYGLLGKSLSQARKLYNKLIIDQTKESVTKLSTTSQEGSSVRDVLANTVVSREIPDLSARIEDHGDQTIYNIMLKDLPAGGLTTPVPESSAKSEPSGQPVPTTSGQPSSSSTEGSCLENLTENVESNMDQVGEDAEAAQPTYSAADKLKSFFEKLVAEGYDMADGFKDQFLREPTRYISVRPNLALHKTWKVVKVTTKKPDGTDEVREVSVLVDGEMVYSDDAGASNQNTDVLMGYDAADKRPFKLIEFASEADKVDLKWVDVELYWHLKFLLIGRPRSTDTTGFLRAESKRYFNGFKTGHIDNRLKFKVINHTVLAVLVPTREEILALRVLGKDKNADRIAEADEFAREGVVRCRTWYGRQRRRQVLNKL